MWRARPRRAHPAHDELRPPVLLPAREGAAEDGNGGGCGETCLDKSTVWGFLTHSDQHVPESMQAPARISYEEFQYFIPKVLKEPISAEKVG